MKNEWGKKCTLWKNYDFQTLWVKGKLAKIVGKNSAELPTFRKFYLHEKKIPKKRKKYSQDLKNRLVVLYKIVRYQ